MKLKQIKSITGTITILTGLHIGGGDSAMHIGGTDNPVVKHPHTGDPYIPGSSLKGKVRSLLELKSGLLKSGRPLTPNDVKSSPDGKLVVKTFGASGADSNEADKVGPTRVLFSDCNLTDEFKRKLKNNRWPRTEVKAENSINRITSVAEHPRWTERVPAGAEFSFQINVRVLDDDNYEELRDLLLLGLKLLTEDALGGSGSRGYGRVSFSFDDNDLQKHFEEVNLNDWPKAA